ncbi:MAG: FliM/FliN family flagellar motor switch protein [Thermoguttaceae bacterium]|nr:FliM/FliN family flagellar motor switch protein [Thermoguttaceae bacterium]MBQ2683162.1 FliM/FliN family flagellar motor switch protein [Thermoguttaceae bacterium]MBQ3332101.1 FliM/FliN family flagellar motor switch protein [Thermoguttaceae bacterium]MBQ3453459.1 FliM/FliN family flagellar motor switch protein [Thermoguttaceae bacterium]MBQ6620827.1 FliM/FliN family flagellar motor switch protein [Thermoguttaceae bacterium]
MNHSEHKRQIDRLVTNAQEALSDLIPGSAAARSPAEPMTDAGPMDETEPMVDIEFARMSFTPEELASARVGTIYSLGKPPSPTVALYREEKKIAEATLFVRDGQLCVRIQHLASE